jgi:hypothetical protein
MKMAEVRMKGTVDEVFMNIFGPFQFADLNFGKKCLRGRPAVVYFTLL